MEYPFYDHLPYTYLIRLTFAASHECISLQYLSPPGAVDARMPHVSYMKAIDYHMFVSFGFIFASLLEYVIVLNIPIKSDRVCIHGHNEVHDSCIKIKFSIFNRILPTRILIDIRVKSQCHIEYQPNSPLLFSRVSTILPFALKNKSIEQCCKTRNGHEFFIFFLFLSSDLVS